MGERRGEDIIGDGNRNRARTKRCRKMESDWTRRTAPEGGICAGWISCIMIGWVGRYVCMSTVDMILCARCVRLRRQTGPDRTRRSTTFRISTPELGYLCTESACSWFVRATVVQCASVYSIWDEIWRMRPRRSGRATAGAWLGSFRPASSSPPPCSRLSSKEVKR